MLLHEVLLWAHVASAGKDEEEVRQAMYGGAWTFDPIYGRAPPGVGLPPTLALGRWALWLIRTAGGGILSELTPPLD